MKDVQCVEWWTDHTGVNVFSVTAPEDRANLLVCITTVRYLTLGKVSFILSSHLSGGCAAVVPRLHCAHYHVHYDTCIVSFTMNDYVKE